MFFPKTSKPIYESLIRFSSIIMQFYIVFILSFFILALFHLFKFLLSSSSSKPYKHLPPSPRGLPIIGNLHQIGSRPHRSLHAMAQTHGPLMLIHLGSVPVLVASSADMAREIMKTHDSIFSNRPQLRIQSILCYGSKDIAFSPYGEYWRQMKSIAVLHLLTNRRVQSYRHVREDEMALMIKKIREANGLEFNLSELLILLTNNIVCQVALGRKFDDKNFKELLERFLVLLGGYSVGDNIPSLKWVDRLIGLERKAKEIAKELDVFYEGVVVEHENKKGVSVEGQDVVDILLEIQSENKIGFHLDRDAIKAIILDLFVAGTDTTFTSLEWAIARLLRHPEPMKKLQKEVREIGQGKPMITEDDLDRMPYLKAVIKETLRLHTPFPLLVPRESTEDVTLFGYNIKRGTRVIINAWAIARDPSVWEEPDEFRPERFLNSSIDYRGLHFELIPFGAGRRGCPGIQFAMVINEIVLANLVYKFDFALAGGEDMDMSETIGVTLHKKNPILVTATTQFE